MGSKEGRVELVATREETAADRKIGNLLDVC
jgi:hypothetical protein